ncbi:TolB family protein [Croceiramulus getboli]|nr:hypothetical protein P8624_14110 [Flavobacteriaceae bacterium YJPT1-3]
MLKYHFLLGLLALSLLSCKSQEEILFSSGRAGNSDIYLMNGNGENVQQLTSSEAEEWAPVWMDDLTISFLRQQGDIITRYGFNIKTKEAFELPQPVECRLDDKNALYALGSQDYVFSCNDDLFLYRSAKQKTQNLTQNIPGKSRYPSWNQIGDRLLFTNDQLGSNDIYELNLRDQSLRLIISSPANDERAEYSPKEDLIVYSSDQEEGGNQEILLFNVNTKTSENISRSPGTELIARFSTSGETIYYGSNKDGNWELYRYHLRDKTTQRLTNDPAFDGDPRVNKF